MTTRFAFAVASLSFALFACRGDDDPNPGTDGGGSGSDGQIAGDVTIQQVQSDEIADGASIELRGVVVTAIDAFGDRTGALWVSEPEGGAFSGVKVFGASVADVANLAVGDLVDLTGAIKREACTKAHPCGTVVFENGASLTEVMGQAQGSLVITKVGTMPVPAPAPVDALAISMIADVAARDAEWEKWEGVLITVRNARQVDGETTFGDDFEDQHEFHVTGGLAVQSGLSEFGTAAVPGACFGTLTGVGDFFFDYILLPRSTSEIAGGGAGCAPLTTTTIAAVQAGTVSGAVMIEDVFVTAVSKDKRSVWISTSLTAASGQGLYVRGGPELPTTIVSGAKVSVLGTVTEFNNDSMGTTLTQLTNPAVLFEEAPTAQPTPVSGLTVALLKMEATGEPYEGVLVTLTNVKVVTVGTTGMGGTAGVSEMAQYPGNEAFKADDDMYLFVAGDAGDCYASITGIWSYNAFGNHYVLLPLNVGTGTGTCL